MRAEAYDAIVIGSGQGGTSLSIAHGISRFRLVHVKEHGVEGAINRYERSIDSSA